MQKVKDYDEQVVQEFLATIGVPDLVADDLHSIVFSPNPPPKKVHKLRGKLF